MSRSPKRVSELPSSTQRARHNGSRTFSVAPAVDKLPRPQKGRVDYRDARCPGLYLRISSSGARTWRAILKVNGKTEARQLGHTSDPNWTLADARDALDKAKALARAGRNPWQEIDGERSRDADTFEAVAKQFLSKYANRELKPSTAAMYKRLLLDWDDTKPLRPMALRDIKRTDIEAVLDRIEARGALVLCNRVRSHLAKFFRWCDGRGYFRDDESLPTARVRRRLTKEKARERALSVAEARAIWSAAGMLGYPWRSYFRLLLLTAARRGEVAAMRWQDVQGDQWTQTENKASRRFLVALVPEAVVELEGAERIGPGDGKAPIYVHTQTGSTPVSGITKALKHLNDKIAELRKEDPEAFEGLFVEHWTIHDIRRTVATEVRRLGFSAELVSALLNHAPKGVTQRHYDLYDQLPEKRAALEAWARLLTAAPAEGAKVLPLKRKRKNPEARGG